MTDCDVENWHFNLHPFDAGQSFTLHIQGQKYCVSPHTPGSRARARGSSPALSLIDESRLTHFAEGVPAPRRAVTLWYVTAPKLRASHLLDRLIITGIHVPRSYRVQGIAKRRREGSARFMPMAVRFLAPEADASAQSLTDDQIADVGSFKDATDAAVSLIFHHPEVMALHPAVADEILSIIHTANGLNGLAQSILTQVLQHEADPNQPSWV